MAKVYPDIYETVFGDENNPEFTARDAAINSDLIMKAVEILKPRYCAGNWGTGFFWDFRIEDKHDENEPEPHYVMHFGEKLTPTFPVHTCEAIVPYCDNYSTQDINIEQAPGKFTVKFTGEFSDEFVRAFVKDMCYAYKNSLRVHFPDYGIVCDMSQFFE